MKEHVCGSTAVLCLLRCLHSLTETSCTSVGHASRDVLDIFKKRTKCRQGSLASTFSHSLPNAELIFLIKDKAVRLYQFSCKPFIICQTLGKVKGQMRVLKKKRYVLLIVSSCVGLCPRVLIFSTPSQA